MSGGAAPDPLAIRAAARVMKELNGRKGLRMDDVDEATKTEMVLAWSKIIVRTMAAKLDELEELKAWKQEQLQASAETAKLRNELNTLLLDAKQESHLGKHYLQAVIDEIKALREAVEAAELDNHSGGPF